MADPSLRRTLRAKKPSLKAIESKFTSTLKDGGFVAPISSSDEEFVFSDENCEDNKEKPQFLHDDNTVKGQELFAFQQRKSRQSLVSKLQESKTPHAVRSKLKSKLKAAFEDSGSEFECSSEEESTDDSSEESDAEDKPNNKQKINVRTLRTRKATKNSKFTINTEEYFANSSNKIKTSNNTLDKLQTPRLPQYELQKLLSNKLQSKEHKLAMQRLSDNTKNEFRKWMYVLNEGFSVLAYGLGSKKHILTQFQHQYLKNKPTIVINGFFPGLTVKSILDAIIDDLLELEENPSNINQAVDLITEELSHINTQLYLLINNIESIKGAKAQSILATLASSPNVNLIASIDHINAPLIWDHNKLSKFNFTWWDCTCYSQYQHETECELSSMTQQNSSLAMSSLRNVFLSLTQNSKSIYLKVAKYQLENSGQYYQGMAFKDLYRSCRESFIVSSDLALRAQLSEFIDHKMIKTKRSIEDGTEYLVIPLANNLLQKFVDDQL